MLPAQSVAVQTTVVFPTGKVFPVGLRDTVTPAQLSWAEAVPSVPLSTTVLQVVATGPVNATTVGGAVIVGGVPSMTVIVWIALALLLWVSVAVNVRVMIRGLATDPAPLLVCETVTMGCRSCRKQDHTFGRSGLVPCACDGAAAGTSSRQV